MKAKPAARARRAAANGRSGHIALHPELALLAVAALEELAALVRTFQIDGDAA